MQFIDMPSWGEGCRLLQGFLPCPCQRHVSVKVTDARCYQCSKCETYLLLDRPLDCEFEWVYTAEVTRLSELEAAQFNPLIQVI